MQELANRFNLSYESDLYSANDHSVAFKKWLVEFEYCYFFIQKNKSTLATSITYPQEYLSHLKELGLEIPTFKKPSKLDQNWWGKLKNKDYEQSLNSKIEVLNLHLHPVEVKLVHGIKEIEDWVTQHNQIKKWLIRSNGKSSGRGQIFFEHDNLSLLKDKIQEWPVVLAPFFKRIYDTGTSLNLDSGEVSKNLNFINSFGVFKGGLSFKNQEVCNQQLKKLVNDIDKSIPVVLNHYQQFLPEERIQFDSFLYQNEEQEFKSYPVLEINYRKSMGQMIDRLAAIAGEEFKYFWVFLPRKTFSKLQSFNEIQEFLHSWNLENKGSISMLSPLTVHLDNQLKELNNLSFLFKAKSFQELILLTDRFAQDFCSNDGSIFELLKSISNNLMAFISD